MNFFFNFNNNKSSINNSNNNKEDCLDVLVCKKCRKKIYPIQYKDKVINLNMPKNYEFYILYSNEKELENKNFLQVVNNTETNDEISISIFNNNILTKALKKEGEKSKIITYKNGIIDCVKYIN